MGLLDKALGVEKDAGEFGSAIGSLARELQSESNGLDFPAVLFSRISKALSIRKGALLLPEKEGKFVPWSIKGFDETTSRRIRIPDSLIQSIWDSPSYSFIELKGSEIDLMKDYFSFREYSVAKSILIAPIKAEKEILALLFICESDISGRENHIKRKLLSQLSQTSGPLLKNRREKIVGKFEDLGREMGGEELQEKINQYLRNVDSDKFLLISLSLSSFIDYLEKKDAGAIRYRLMQDILRLINTLI
ncbi:MAG: hypothetical protein MJA31_13575, partial [Clostridia bacterium]|nr:hypothetical protein [Clostridia bacterium]